MAVSKFVNTIELVRLGISPHPFLPGGSAVGVGPYRTCRNLSKVILVLLGWRNLCVDQFINASPKRGDYGR